MSTSGELEFKIGIIGPTRVGKTSLIASILKDSQRLLEGSPVSIGPRGTATERRVAQHHKELEGSLRAGEFNPGAVKGTEEAFTFELELDPGVDSAGIHLSVLDYPGGWLDAERRPPEREEDWKRCRQWMTDSTVLMIPVESAVLMEAAAARNKKAIPHILTTYEVAQVAREWAKGRAKRSREPALLLLCPVKCESYFADNGGLRDSSTDLFNAVRDLYHEVLQSVRGESAQVKVLYAPVDTIGCVEIIKATWDPDGDAPGGFEFSADYRVRPPGRQAVKGADAALVSLCRHLVDAKTRIESGVAEAIAGDAEAAKRHAEKDEGFFGNFWLWLSRERKHRREIADARQTEASAHRKMVESLEETVERLASREFGPRVREM